MRKEVGEKKGVKLKSRFNFHPFIGYTGKPAEESKGRNKTPYNQYGMLSKQKHPYPYKKKKNEFVIAVVGGSVAEIFANGMEEHLGESMRKLGFGKKVIIINLAIGGFKQPQQLFHLEYALLSGFQFDAVLNIDGFNDLVLANNNIELGVNPLYPSVHSIGSLTQLLNQKIPGRNLVEFLSDYYELFDFEQNYLSILQKFPAKYSAFLSFTGEIVSGYCKKERQSLKFDWTLESSEKIPSTFRGPKLTDNDNNIESVTEIWQQASKMLFAICNAYNLHYIQILQPNQYLEGSKTFTDNELKIAISDKSKWGQCAKVGYKSLIVKGNELKEQGVPFYDLSMVFKDYKKDIYVDNCCHYNYTGNYLLARRIARIIYKQVSE
ncbi:MAG: hypothetical protein GY707_08785 [Desulfobacteraceae bacterium]|nr:hypothetical protein [Desulfobacteraceae bacterium]